MGVFSYIFDWAIAAVLAALVASYWIGRSRSAHPGGRSTQRQRRAALQSVHEVLQAIEELTHSMGDRNLELREAHRHVGDLEAPGDLAEVQQSLLRQMAGLLRSNQKLNDDLEYTQCRLEDQALELDRTRREARTDPLTGIANRKAFDHKLRLLLGRWRRQADPFVLILMDVDHFKWINDNHGHLIGDRVLEQLGRLILEVLRDGDFVARLGGDEFAILLPDVSPVDAQQIAERLRAAIDHSNFGFPVGDREGAVTVSLGIAFPEPSDTPEQCVGRADEALYEAKRAGRNRLVGAAPTSAAAEPRVLDSAASRSHVAAG